MDRVENIIVDISVTCSDQNTAFDFKFILFPLFLLLLSSALPTLKLRSFVIIEISTVVHLVFSNVVTLGFLVDFDFIFFLLLVWDIELFQNDSFQLAVTVVNLRCLFLLLERVVVASLLT